MTTATASTPVTPPRLPHRTLGRTGVPVSIFGLGGEGILRTRGRHDAAHAVIRAAVDHGVTYMDTAPAYQDSRDYLGAALGPDRARVFLASKTHVRDAAGTQRLVEDSLTRLRTDHLDLLQLHDLRTMDELDVITGRGGALEGAMRAREQGLVRWLGITGHQDPEVLLEAMRRFDFDTVLTVVNPAEPTGRSFMRHVIPEARRRGMGVIGMKVLSRGLVIPLPGVGSAEAALRYAWSADVDVAIVGCSTPAEVANNAAAARAFMPLAPGEMTRMEEQCVPHAHRINDFKVHAA